MPIKSLESYLFERKLVNTSSIEILQNATIGIDVEHYLSRIYTFKKEQFLSAIGGIPSSLKDYIQSDLQVFKEFNIKPIFVLSGLDIQLQANNYNVNQLGPSEQHLENTWSKLNTKNSNPYSYSNMNSDSFRLFTDPLPLRPMINDLIKYFIEIDVDYLVCPYDASFQLSYLYNTKVIDSIYGSTDLLLTKVEKFILGMEFQSKDFRFIDKYKVLNELNLNERQLVDLSIMVGCNLQPTTFPNFPPLPKPNPIQPYPQLSYFKLGLDMLYQYSSFKGNSSSDIYGYILSLNDQRCLDLYYKGHAALKYNPVLNDEGYVTLYSSEMLKLDLLDESDDFILEERTPDEKDEDNKSEVPSSDSKSVPTKEGNDDDNNNTKTIKVPNNLHDVLSQRLPPEVYFYQSIGLAPIELLEAITQGQMNIRPPLESGLNDSFKRLINSKFYIENLDSLFNLITQLLARYYQVKRIKVNYWYKTDDLELNNRMIPPVSRKINHLFYVNPEVKNFNLINFFKNVDEKYSTDTFTGEISNNNEIISTVMLRTLFLFDIIDKKTNELTNFGKLIKKFVDEQETKLDVNTLQEIILISLLMKSDTLKLYESSREFTSVAKNFKELNNDPSSEFKLENDEFKFITLISRVLSVHKLNISPINYQGPISRSLLNFRSHLKFISNNLIYTLQSCLLDLISRQANNNIKVNYEDKKDWYNLINDIPFYRDINNTLLGVIGEIYFEYSLKQLKLNKDLSKEQIIENSQDHLLNSVYQINNSTFNINVHGVNSITSKQLLGDFKNGIKFWNTFVEFANVMKEDKLIINEEYWKTISEADKWMKQFV